MVKAASGKVGFWRRWRAGRKKVDKDFLIAQVLARHAGWFPAYNRGRLPTAEAEEEWRRRLQPLSERELVVLIADNRVRNRLLGKRWHFY